MYKIFLKKISHDNLLGITEEKKKKNQSRSLCLGKPTSSGFTLHIVHSTYPCWVAMVFLKDQLI